MGAKNCPTNQHVWYLEGINTSRGVRRKVWKCSNCPKTKIQTLA